MATSTELANELTFEELKAIARDKDVDISDDATKDDLVRTLVNDPRVAREDFEAYIEDEDDEEYDEDNPTASSSEASTDGLDPFLVDPLGAARERAEGTTSDASKRTAEDRAADTPADRAVLNRPSDGGPDRYPFPTAGDVEVATVEPGEGEGEFMRPLEVEDWVVLGEHELVPARLVGRRAVILEAPREPIEVGKEAETWVRVRTRDDVNATLHIPLDAVAEIQRGGLAATIRG